MSLRSSLLVVILLVGVCLLFSGVHPIIVIGVAAVAAVVWWLARSAE